MIRITVPADIIITSGLKMSPTAIALAVENALNVKETMTIEGKGCSRPYVGIRFHFKSIRKVYGPLKNNEIKPGHVEILAQELREEEDEKKKD
jgi:hypothetical protein